MSFTAMNRKSVYMLHLTPAIASVCHAFSVSSALHLVRQNRIRFDHISCTRALRQTKAVRYPPPKIDIHVANEIFNRHARLLETHWYWYLVLPVKLELYQLCPVAVVIVADISRNSERIENELNCVVCRLGSAAFVPCAKWNCALLARMWLCRIVA